MEMYNNNGEFIDIQKGVFYGQNARVDELNERISSRHFSDMPLEPNYNPRPVPTKYSLFPIVDRRKPVKEYEMKYPVHDCGINFNPGNAKAPSRGFLTNIDTETILRNQVCSLQHGADQSLYVPSSKSELYNVTVVSKPSSQPHPLLFSRSEFTQEMHPNMQSSNVGKDTFFNHTRTQLRNGF
jgi:hypothetical protein